MNRRTPILRIVASCVWLAALATLTSCDKLGGDKGSPTGPSSPPAAGSSITYAAIGASDANGLGSSSICGFLDACPNGMGYVPVAARQLRSQGFTVNLTNLGIPTAVIGPDFQQMGQRYQRTILGNFIDQEVPFVPTTATLVTIFAGGNDVNVITDALGHGAGGNDPSGFIDAQVTAFRNDYAALLQGIRSRAAQPRIVLLNLPNLAALPYLSGASAAQRQAAQRAAVGMTRNVINPLASASVSIVDLMCDSRSYNPSIYSSDGFHPNDNGYAYIGGEVVRAITSASYPAPQSSCAQMTIVP
jgi:lysophospholipase L1-like esterase